VSLISPSVARFSIDTAGLGAHWQLGERLAGVAHLQFGHLPPLAPSNPRTTTDGRRDNSHVCGFPAGFAEERVTLVMYWVLSGSTSAPPQTPLACPSPGCNVRNRQCGEYAAAILGRDPVHLAQR
jgi:hypothetical protein